MLKEQTSQISDSADGILHEFIGTLNEETAFHRMEQQKVKCGFGLAGVCCRLCANGPCRVTPDSPRGVCGANADTIVARNFLRAVAAGSGCYIHVLENTARNLREAAKRGEPIKSVETLDRLAGIFGVEEPDTTKRAIAVADRVLSDIYKPSFEKMELVEKLAYPPRYENWKKLGILPGGAKSEVFDGVVKTSTNLNSDPVNMLLHCLRLGVSTGLYGLELTNLLNDVMLGEPVISLSPVGLRTIDPDYINIMLTGHQQSMFMALIKRLRDDKVQARAREKGARGIRLVGCTCVGQDFQLRGEHYRDIFAGHAGNNFTSEAVLATGGIDLVVSEFNCTLPGLEPIADAHHVSQICIDDVAKKANADFLPIDKTDPDKAADRMIESALGSFEKRRATENIRIRTDHGNDDTLTGISEGSLKKFLGGSWKPLVDLIVEGKIKGVAGVVGCSNLRAKGHDLFTVELTRELIARDIIVLSAGCSSGGLENVGLMSPGAAKYAGDSLRAVCESLGIAPVLNFGPCLSIGRLEMVATELAAYLKIDIPQLPLVLSAPQWLEEQALADGAFGLTLGLPLHLGLNPFISGSPVVTEVLTEKMTELTGGRLIVERDVKTAADKIEAIIFEKRKALSI